MGARLLLLGVSGNLPPQLNLSSTQNPAPSA